VVGVQEPLAISRMWLEVKSEILPRLPQPVVEIAPPLDERLLGNVVDDRPMPMLEGRQRDEWKRWEVVSYDLFCQAVREVARAPAEAFAKSARENEGIVWAQLFRDAKRHRGKVVAIKGRLKMLRRIDVIPVAVRDAVHDLYEGWVFTETPNANPVVVVFPDLPDGIKTGEKVDYQVAFNGYFLLRFGYLTGYVGPDGKNKARRTLLFVAPTITSLSGHATADRDDVPAFGKLSGPFLAAIISVFSGTILLVMALGWWLRRGDKRFHSRLDDVRAAMFDNSDLAAHPGPGEQITGVRPEQPPAEGGAFSEGPTPGS